MVAIIRTDEAEEKYLDSLWEERSDGYYPRWVTTQSLRSRINTGKVLISLL